MVLLHEAVIVPVASRCVLSYGPNTNAPVEMLQFCTTVPDTSTVDDVPASAGDTRPPAVSATAANAAHSRPRIIRITNRPTPDRGRLAQSLTNAYHLRERRAIHVG
jgi:hypothetical protein